MSRAVEWREAVEKAKTLEQRFELRTSGTSVEVGQAGIKFYRADSQVFFIEATDEELVRLGHWLYETFFDAEGVE